MKTIQNGRATHCLKHFVTWLNYGGAAADDFRQLTDLLKAMALDDTVGPERRHKARLAWSRKTLPLSRRIAKRYPIMDNFVLPLERGNPPFSSSEPFRKQLQVNELAACNARGHLREIIAAGLLSKIGRCKLDSCRRYFCGRVGRLFCSDACMRKHMRHTPEFRKKNAEHQRAHYDKYFRKKPLTRGHRRNQQTRRRESR